MLSSAPGQTAAARPATLSAHAASGYALALVSAVLFSTKSVVIKLAYAAGSDAEALLALRMAIALPIYIGIWLLNQRGAHASGVSLNGALLAASVGVLGYGLSSYLDIKGLEYISAPVERLMMRLSWRSRLRSQVALGSVAVYGRRPDSKGRYLLA